MMFGERCSSQDWATAVGVAPSRLATDDSTSDCTGEKPPSGKYGTYAMCCSAVAASIASSARVGEVVEVLHARHRGDPLRLGQLVEADRAQAQVPDQALLPQLGERLELRTDGVRSRRAVIDPGEGPEVDHIEQVEPEPAEVVVHLRAQRLWQVAGQPAAPLVADHPDLGHDVHVVAVREERLPDDLVGDVRPVGLGRVDVVDAQLDRGPQHVDGGGAVARRPEDARAGEPHRAVADPVEVEVPDPVGAGPGVRWVRGGHGGIVASASAMCRRRIPVMPRRSPG